MKYSVSKQIKYLRHQKGILFDKMSEDAARQVLQNRTYYYKVTCFRKNFIKNQQGRYLDVDFAILNDLAVIDMRLRYLLLHLTLDLEHAVKTRLVESITLSNEDGYSILREFDEHEKSRYEARLDGGPSKKRSPYRDIQSMHMRKVDSHEYDYHLINAYDRKNPSGKPLPVWVFLEKVSYGGLEKFIHFYVESKKSNYKIFKPATDLLMYSKRIRDAAAHNRPILMNIGNNRHAGVIQNRVSSDVERFIIERTGHSKGTPEHARVMKKMKNTKVHDLLCVFMLHRLYVSPEIQQARQRDIESLLERARYRKELYVMHPHMTSIFEVFASILSQQILSE
ncbi:Abi family protein [Exiguobacterium sp. s26]|uniref:Abi family protein n=1 Tax=Exiguobacterium sp. s26 TaxID=2751231 RepID=UPI001BE881DF|nr:Abi family protein [Exiguobacterium sp. s26]